ncbi:hypothetical protein [Vibrio brasiliensis]
MTWVVGGNCFNGFVCVADIQVTLEYKNKPRKYYNCVQKIHKVYDNLCVAFSGDIRSGLIIIEDLQKNLHNSIKENEYFDLDGQSKELIEYLKTVYKKINGTKEPYLELMFLWNAQEGDELHYRSYLMTFRSPSFNMSSTKVLDTKDTGFGKYDNRYKSISNLLSGKENDLPEFSKLKGEIEDIPTVWTVEKFKNFVFAEASQIDFPGVSKSLICFESVIEHKDIFPDWVNNMLKTVFENLGVNYSTKNTANHSVNIVEMDIGEIDRVIKYLSKNDPEKLDVLKCMLALAVQEYDPSCLHKLPKVTNSYHADENEIIHSPQLFTKWKDLREFLKLNGEVVNACSAISA